MTARLQLLEDAPEIRSHMDRNSRPTERAPIWKGELSLSGSYGAASGRLSSALERKG